MNGIGFGIGIDMDLSGFITHMVTITMGKDKTIQYKATCMKDDDDGDSPTTLYKIVNGEKDYENHIEISDDESVTICIDGEYYFADIIDFDIDGGDLTIECEDNFSDEQIHIQCDLLLGSDECNYEDTLKFSTFNLDGNELDEDDDENWDDDDDDDDDDNNNDEKFDKTLAFARQHPYFNSCKTVAVDQGIFEQVPIWVKRYANFYSTHCENEQFIEVIDGFLPNFNKEHTLILCVNDLLICMEKLGIELEAVSRGGMVFTALLMKLQNQIDIESSINFHNLTNEDADNAQDSMDDIHRVCSNFTGVNTFFVSTVIASYDTKKANRYISIMEEIANILVDLYKDWDEDVELNEDFIDEISDLKL